MLRTDDIAAFVLLTGAKETIDNLRCDVSLTRRLEEEDQKEQGNVSDNEEAYLDNLQILHRQLDEIQDRIDMTLAAMNDLEKDREYQYRVGVYYPDFADQPYLRDRDEWIVSDSPSEAIRTWLVLHKNWIRPDERKMVKVFESKRAEAAPPDDDHDDEYWDEMAKRAEYERSVLRDHIHETGR